MQKATKCQRNLLAKRTNAASLQQECIAATKHQSKPMRSAATTIDWGNSTLGVYQAASVSQPNCVSLVVYI